MLPVLRNFPSRLRAFVSGQDGLITTDYIIVTGAIMGISLSATVAVRTGVDSLGAGIESSLTASQVARIMAGPGPVRWLESSAMETGGSKCSDPISCDYVPPTRWERAVLELDDGSKVTRETTIEHPQTNPTITSVVWFDEDGNEIEPIEDAPDIEKAGLVCDKFNEYCGPPSSATK